MNLYAKIFSENLNENEIDSFRDVKVTTKTCSVTLKENLT